MRHTITTLLVFCTVAGVQAQPDRFWYFGANGVGIDWGGCEPEIVEGGILGDEGTITVSSPEGALLFYSNSDFVWDSTDNLMQNGEISNAFFDPVFYTPEVSTLTQLAAAKKPGVGNVYYLFSSDIQNIGAYNLRYVTIDMDLNGGLGSVTGITTLGTNPMTEKLCTVPKSAGEGFWFIAHEYLNNRFLVFDINAGGVNPVPQIFDLGLPHLASNNSLNTRGELKANIAGNRLAMVQDQLNGAVEIFDFNPATGAISNPMAIDEINHGYGVSFSPNGALLYVSTCSSTASAPNFVYQYNLNAGDATQIGASRVTLQTAPVANPFGSIKLAPDGNLYVTKPGTALDRINAADVQGLACDYQSNALNLGFGISRFGLNNIWEIQPQGSQLGIPNLTTSVTSCGPVSIGVEALPGVTYLWSTGATTATITVSESGVYGLEVTEAGCVRSGEVNVEIGALDLDLGPDIEVCAGTPVILESNALTGLFEWSTGASTSTLTVSEPGVYTLVVTQGGCVASDAVAVSFVDVPEINFEDGIVLCPGETITLAPGSPSLSYLWSDGSTAPTYTSSGNETVSVTVSNGNCSATASVQVVALDTDENTLGDISVAVCEGESFTILKPAGWEVWTIDADTIATDAVTLPPGEYTSAVSNACGTRSFLAEILSEDCSCPVYLPNSFTPNGDGINELFRPSLECERGYILRIYDRWGSLIFDSETTGLPGWNGSGIHSDYFAESGWYVWTLNLDEFNGRLFPEVLIGSVMLLR